MEHEVQKYFLLMLKQMGKKQKLHRHSTSKASTLPPQCGQHPGACCLPNSFSSTSHRYTKHIFLCFYLSFVGFVAFFSLLVCRELRLRPLQFSTVMNTKKEGRKETRTRLLRKTLLKREEYL